MIMAVLPKLGYTFSMGSIKTPTGCLPEIKQIDYKVHIGTNQRNKQDYPRKFQKLLVLYEVGN
jgi:hypothetical protein